MVDGRRFSLNKHCTQLFKQMLDAERSALERLSKEGARVWEWDRSSKSFTRCNSLRNDNKEAFKAIVLLQESLKDRCVQEVHELSKSRSEFKAAVDACVIETGATVAAGERSTAEPVVWLEQQCSGVIYSTADAWRSGQQTIEQINELLKSSLEVAQSRLTSHIASVQESALDDIEDIRRDMKAFQALCEASEADAFFARYHSGTALRVRPVLFSGAAPVNSTFQRLLFALASDDAKVTRATTRKSHKRITDELLRMLRGRLLIYPTRG